MLETAVMRLLRRASISSGLESLGKMRYNFTARPSATLKALRIASSELELSLLCFLSSG